MTHRGFKGHPARQDPDVEKLFRTMKAAIELTRDMEDKLPAETYVHLKASALGLMEAYAKATGKPSPIEIILVGLEEMAVSK